MILCRNVGSHYLNRRQLFISLISVGPTVPLIAESLATAQSRKPGAPGTQGTPLQFNVRDFGAKGDGATKDTSALQRALDRCAALGGGEVLVPAGNYRTGAIALRSS